MQSTTLRNPNYTDVVVTAQVKPGSWRRQMSARPNGDRRDRGCAPNDPTPSASCWTGVDELTRAVPDPTRRPRHCGPGRGWGPRGPGFARTVPPGHRRSQLPQLGRPSPALGQARSDLSVEGRRPIGWSSGRRGRGRRPGARRTRGWQLRPQAAHVRYRGGGRPRHRLLAPIARRSTRTANGRRCCGTARGISEGGRDDTSGFDAALSAYLSASPEQREALDIVLNTEQAELSKLMLIRAEGRTVTDASTRTRGGAQSCRSARSSAS